MFILSSSECRNIHPCTHIYISVYNPRCLCMAECGSPGHVRKPQGWQKPVTDKWSPKETQRWPLQLQSHSQKKGWCAPGARGALPTQGCPHHPSPARGTLGDTRVLWGGQSHPDISVTSGALGTFFACLSSPNSSCTCSNGW